MITHPLTPILGALVARDRFGHSNQLSSLVDEDDKDDYISGVSTILRGLDMQKYNVQF